MIGYSLFIHWHDCKVLLILYFNFKNKVQNSELLYTEKIITERKVFFVDLKENARGRVVKITEDVSGNRDTIMVPVDILDEFIEALQNVSQAAQD